MTIPNLEFIAQGRQLVCHHLLDTVGNTPLLKMKLDAYPGIQLFAKLEYFNPTGSIKARAASYILNRALQEGIITRNTTIVESSSGNFGLALSAYCNRLGLKFKCVVDPNISPYNKMLIQQYGAEIIMVTEPDESGGYLITRIRKVQELLGQIEDAYWINQYGNPLNSDAYYTTLGSEICEVIPDLAYVFVGVSSGGTITGLSQRLKEHYPEVKIIAVDIKGSVVFGGPPAKRYIPGIGSSMVPPILKMAKVDDVVMIEEYLSAEGCYDLLNKHHLFLGGSSGALYAGMNLYFHNNPPEEECNVLAIFPDGGEKYIDTIFNEQWRQEKFGNPFGK